MELFHTLSVQPSVLFNVENEVDFHDVFVVFLEKIRCVLRASNLYVFFCLGEKLERMSVGGRGDQASWLERERKGQARSSVVCLLTVQL